MYTVLTTGAVVGWHVAAVTVTGLAA